MVRVTCTALHYWRTNSDYFHKDYDYYKFLYFFLYFWSQMCISCVSLNVNHNLKRNHFIHVLCRCVRWVPLIYKHTHISSHDMDYWDTCDCTWRAWMLPGSPTAVSLQAYLQHYGFFFNKHCLIALSHSYFILKSQNKNFPNMQNMSGCIFCQQSFSEVLNNLKNVI